MTCFRCKNVKFEKIPQLRAAFSIDGTVTAANASTINDGASALILASTKAVKKYNLKPIAKILSFADAAQEPQWFTTAPTIAAPKALKLAKMNSNDVDFFEVNEAFSVVPLAFFKSNHTCKSSCLNPPPRPPACPFLLVFLTNSSGTMIL